MVSVQPFRFVHTGDLHLDSPFAGLSEAVPTEIGAALRGSTLSAWERVVQLALDERVDAFLVAGDAFEHEQRSLLAQVRFRDGLGRLSDAGIASYVVTGNHDPLSGWEPTVAWPPLAYRFPADAVVERPLIRGDGVELARVYGISYAVRDVTTNLAGAFRRGEGAPYAIGLLHANVGTQPGHAPYAPCTLADLRAAGMDYWALGHVHRHAVLSPRDPVVVYCGNPQGRDPGEAEPRGCYLVEVDAAGGTTPHFVATDRVRWRLLEVSIDGVETEEALVRAVGGAVAAAHGEAGRSLVARVTLTGRGPLHASLLRGNLLADVRQLAQEQQPAGGDFAWIESLRDATRPAAELGGAVPGTFPGELAAEADAARQALLADGGERDDAAAQDAAADGAGWEEELDDLYAHHRVRRLLRGRRPSRDRVLELLGEAERLALERLADGAERVR